MSKDETIKQEKNISSVDGKKVIKRDLSAISGKGDALKTATGALKIALDGATPSLFEQVTRKSQVLSAADKMQQLLKDTSHLSELSKAARGIMDFQDSITLLHILGELAKNVFKLSGLFLIQKTHGRIAVDFQP